MATQRTRTASKALIPNLSDPVGKLNGLGGMTVKKLLDLGHNVRESRSSVLSEVPLESASTGRPLMSQMWLALRATSLNFNSSFVSPDSQNSPFRMLGPTNELLGKQAISKHKVRLPP